MIELVTYRTEDSGVKMALIREGYKNILVLMMRDRHSGILSTETIRRSERRFMSEVIRKGKPYPLYRAIKVFRNFAKADGRKISKSAKKMLREGSAQ